MKRIQSDSKRMFNGQAFFQILLESQDFLSSLYSVFEHFNNIRDRVLEISEFKFEIPYLNGGLFRLSEEESDIICKLKRAQWKEIFEFLNSYHWIIENEIEEEENKVLTPEILGHVYERSVVEWESKGFKEEVAEASGEKSERKTKGVYYTPEYVTDYICKHAVYPFLIRESKANFETIEQILTNGSKQDLNRILNCLDLIRVCDPACGSGTFLIKAAEVLFQLRLRVLAKLGIEPRYYQIKLDIITKNIHGVDILQGAAEIAKLRLWLWLISSYDEDADITPLPNIEYNILVGDSLVGWLDEKLEITLTSPLTDDNERTIERLSSLTSTDNRSKITQAKNLLNSFSLENYITGYGILHDMYKQAHGETGEMLLDLLTAIRKSVYQNLNRSYLNYVEEQFSEKMHLRIKSSEYPILNWKFDFGTTFSKGGFDVVIGNPPYVDSETMVRADAKYRDVLTGMYQSTKGNWDYYVPFFERAMQLTRENGMVCFISANKWLAKDYGESLRSILSEHLTRLCNCDEIKVFKDAGNSPVISFYLKGTADQPVAVDYFSEDYEVLSRNPVSRKIIAMDNWGLLTSPYLDTLLRILAQQSRLSEYFKVESAFTTSEAYELKRIIRDGNPSKNDFKFVNTGTIEPFETLWGKKTTSYIKKKYERPFVRKSDLRKLMPTRYELSTSPKLIISGMRILRILSGFRWFISCRQIYSNST